MRGKETPSLVVVRGSRITPAYAGKSLPEELEQALPKDHPRVCGEKACMQCTLQGHGGSPPRMRGKGRRNGRAFPGNGITPAYAGKSGHAINPNVCGQDHPRVCGEKSPFSLFRPPHLGSPPRMRGKVYSRTCSIVLDGITPAYAGKSFLMFLRSGLLRDHPRVCGEKGSRIFQDPAGMGSPPRMRGKVMRRFSASAVGGITPAYAGKRLLRQLRHITSRDHPRVCGEKQNGNCPPGSVLGSPPRMRGKAIRRIYIVHDDGITPAYAGKRCTGAPDMCKN